MWNLFGKKSLLPENDKYFQIECYRWLLTHFGGDEFFVEAKLILPTKDYFPGNVESSEEAIKAVFEQIKKYAGMQEWPCLLEQQEEDPNIVVGETLLIQGAPSGPLGTFSYNENNEACITYNPKIASEPIQLVATFAHELSHYLTGAAPEPPPGGWENCEFATDIGATFLGFGIFVANAAFNFRQYSDAGTTGWSTSGGGYLTEAEYSYALAIFLLLKDISPDMAYPHCDTNIQSYLKKALNELENSKDIEELKEVKLIPRKQN